MPSITDTLIIGLPTPIQCPVCGFYCEPDIEACPRCKTPCSKWDTITTIDLTYAPHTLPGPQLRDDQLAADQTVILQILPSGACLHLALEEPVILGRSAENDPPSLVSLNEYNAYEHGVSRFHCRLFRDGEFLALTDLNSTNNTYLNDQILLPNQTVHVAHEDKLILGSLHIFVTFSSIPAAQ
jgi:pSer/pThr/pTyr-binding forkhead associated (FHA) protein